MSFTPDAVHQHHVLGHDGDTFCINGKTSLYPYTSQQGKPWMLLVMPKLPYFEIAGHFCALVQLCKPSAGKGPCE
jgi:hypothetical protein